MATNNAYTTTPSPNMPSSLYTTNPMNGMVYSTNTIAPPTATPTTVCFTGSSASIGVQRRPMNASMTTLPKAAAHRSPKARNGTAAMPSTVMNRSTNSTGVSSMVSSAARIEWPGFDSNNLTQCSTAPRNRNAIKT
jgi:hypothetical protein